MVFKSLVSTSSSSFTKWLFKRELQLQTARASTSLYFSCCLAFFSFWNNFIHFGTILLSLSRLLSVSSLSSLSRFQAFQLFEPLLALLVWNFQTFFQYRSCFTDDITITHEHSLEKINRNEVDLTSNMSTMTCCIWKNVHCEPWPRNFIDNELIFFLFWWAFA